MEGFQDSVFSKPGVTGITRLCPADSGKLSGKTFEQRSLKNNVLAVGGR